MLPQVLPIFSNGGLVLANLNYTPLVFLIVLGGAGIWYAVSARHWFKGPRIQGTPEELAAIEAELNVI
jgi:hypothetical protein